MRKELWALALPLVMACSLAQPTPQVVVQTVVVQPTRVPATAEPRPTAVQAFDPTDLGWLREPSYDDTCNYECRSYSYSNSDMLMHTYPDGLTLSLYLDANDPEGLGYFAGLTMVYFGISEEAGTAIGDALQNPAVAARMIEGTPYYEQVGPWYISMEIFPDTNTLIIWVFRGGYFEGA